MFWPATVLVGIYVMWKRSRFTAAARVVLTAVGALLVFGVVASAGQGRPATSAEPVSPVATSVVAVVPETPAAPIVVTPPPAPQPDPAPVIASTTETEPVEVVEVPAVEEPAVEEPAVEEPAPLVNTTPTKSKSQSITVYRTRTGKKYHMDGCRFLRQSQIAVSLKKAKSLGLGACSICDPPS
jgi:hypothetical protein